MAPVFETTITSHGGTTAGIEVPEEILAELGSGRRPAVVVWLGDYTYRSTVAVMGGENLIGVSNKVRAASGLAIGDTVQVELTLDTEPRVITHPTTWSSRSTPPRVPARHGTGCPTATSAGTPRRSRRPSSPRPAPVACSRPWTSSSVVDQASIVDMSP